MSDWLIVHLSSFQAGIMRGLATELRAGGIGTIVLAFTLGAAHALTPGHGKSAFAAYFLGTEAGVSKGLRTAFLAAFLHVLSGLAAFVVLRLLLGLMPSMSGRPSFPFLVLGYVLVLIAGFMLLFQSLRPRRSAHDGVHALTAGIGLLPCPLTVSVLGFAWTQGNTAMVGLILLSLALGISVTIGAVAVLAIITRKGIGTAVADKVPQFDNGARVLQGAAGIAIIAIATYTIAKLQFG